MVYPTVTSEPAAPVLPGYEPRGHHLVNPCKPVVQAPRVRALKNAKVDYATTIIGKAQLETPLGDYQMRV